jgi:hypothetical protein
MTGKYRHEQVGHRRPEEAAGNNCCAGWLFEPVAEHKRDHHADGGGTFVELSGHGLARHRGMRACRLHLMDARRYETEHTSLKMIGSLLGS